MKINRIILKKGRSKPFFEGHPWVFSGAIASVPAGVTDGDQVAVTSHEGAFIAWGIYNSASQIRVRLISWDEGTQISASLINRRVLHAIKSRRDVPDFTDSRGAIRLVFSEADGLSGLVVDRYADFAVVQVTSLAILLFLPEIVTTLQETGSFKGIYLKVDKETNQWEGTSQVEESLWGETPPETLIIQEHGLDFLVNIRRGQKTGFYLDQKRNRLRLRDFVKGRKVLDLFCYTGGFALNAALAGASEVEALDASQYSLDLAEQNRQINKLEGIRFTKADAFDWLQDKTRGAVYDVIILDPPKMLKHKGSLSEALQGYGRLNQGAIQCLKPGGLLLTHSCSGLVSREDFMRVLGMSAAKTGRHVQVIDVGGPSPDHPLSVTCPETEYLKSFYCRAW